MPSFCDCFSHSMVLVSTCDLENLLQFARQKRRCRQSMSSEDRDQLFATIRNAIDSALADSAIRSDNVTSGP